MNLPLDNLLVTMPSDSHPPTELQSKLYCGISRLQKQVARMNVHFYNFLQEGVQKTYQRKECDDG